MSVSRFSFTCLLLIGIIMSITASCSKEAPQKKQQSQNEGLSREDLKIASQTVVGYWEEEDAMSNDESRWTGTSAVVASKSGKLYLITNNHCLNLLELKNADLSRDVEVASYNLTIKFPTGVTRQVLRFATSVNGLDIAFLEIDGSGLTEGIDFVFLSPLEHPSFKTGTSVVAVGTPLNTNLAGTQTHGRISALRGSSPRQIQTDAAINHGNSGGPLFVETDNERYFWIGVNTWIVEGANNIGFAIDARDAMQLSKCHWYSCDASGAGLAVLRLK